MKLLIVLGLFPLLPAAPAGGFGPAVPAVPEFYREFHRATNNNFDLDLGQVKILADILIAELRALDAEPSSASIIRDIFEKNNKICLRDMNDAILAIQEGTQLVEDASGDIQSLVEKVENMIGLKDETEIVREVASIMRSLQPLLTKISPDNPRGRICRSSSENTFDYLHSLAVLLEEFSNDPRLAVNSEMQKMLVYSGSVVAGVTSLLQDLDRSQRELQTSCSGEAMSVLGKIMLSLADMVSTLGGISNGEVIRVGHKVTERIQVMEYLMDRF